MSSIASLASALFAIAGADGVPATTVPAPPAALSQDAPPVQYPQWTGALALGATWATGNTENETISGTFNAVRRDEKDRWTFDLYENYGKTTDHVTDVESTTNNNYGGSAKYDYFASKKLYLFGNGSGKVDHVADLDLRYIFGAGAGYQWTESEKVKWGTEAGLSYVDENFKDNTADTNFLAVRLASNLTYQISKTASFEQVAEILPSLEDSDDVIARVDNRLKLSIVGRWIAQIQYVVDFDHTPPPGNEQTDQRVVLSVGWSLGS